MSQDDPGPGAGPRGGPDAEQELTPEEEAEVSRLLGELSGPIPTPPDVVARLEETLAGLREGSAPDRAAALTPLAAPAPGRVRRRWPRVVLAAAALLVGGYSLGTLPDSGTVAGSAGGGDAGTAADGGAEERSGGSVDSGEPEPEATGARQATSAPGVALEADRFADDVRRQLPRLLAADQEAVTAGRRCEAPPLRRRAEWFLVRFEGEPASLVLDRRDPSRVGAQVYSCEGPVRLARAELVGAEQAPPRIR